MCLRNIFLWPETHTHTHNISMLYKYYPRTSLSTATTTHCRCCRLFLRAILWLYFAFSMKIFRHYFSLLKWCKEEEKKTHNSDFHLTTIEQKITHSHTISHISLNTKINKIRQYYCNVHILYISIYLHNVCLFVCVSANSMAGAPNV